MNTNEWVVHTPTQAKDSYETTMTIPYTVTAHNVDSIPTQAYEAASAIGHTASSKTGNFSLGTITIQNLDFSTDKSRVSASVTAEISYSPRHQDTQLSKSEEL
ncbi:MAG: hypothetical protein QM632_05440 [Micrococcaceae bacterium]